MTLSRRITSRRDNPPDRALSMTETLVVIAVVALLLALLVPSLEGAREQVRRMMCSNNMRQFGLALHFYRQDFNDYLPKEGTYWHLERPDSWFNALPPYLNLPRYIDIQGAGEDIRERPELDVWICPSKNLTGAYKSHSGKNQFHYGMNQVLDGLGSTSRPSRDAPGFPDTGDHVRAARFRNRSRVVFMFDIVWNSPAGTPRDVATMYQRSFTGGFMGKFHGDYANVLYVDGGVGHCRTDDLVTGRDFRHGDVIWDAPHLYWGY